VFFLAWLVGVVTLPYQWVRDWLQRRKSGSEDEGPPVAS
jgi:hypothetical protein